MKKIEILWREILFQSLENNNFFFKETDLANKFGFSSSTVFQCLKPLRKMGAVKVSGRGFEVIDSEKILYFWASLRDYKKEIIYKTYINLNPLEIEAQIPAGIIYGFYSAYRLKFGETPADYNRVLVYGEENILEKIEARFPEKEGIPNFYLLKADQWLKDYGQITTTAQIFVDLWNEDTWYAKEFIRSLLIKINKE